MKRRVLCRPIYLLHISVVLLFSFLLSLNTFSNYAEVPVAPSSPMHLVVDVRSAEEIWCQFISRTQPFLRPSLFSERAKFTGRTDKVALLIDDRNNLAYFWAIPWTLYMLGPEWKLQIFARESNKSFFLAIIRRFALDNVLVETMEEVFGYGSWVDDAFMRRVQFMLSKQFWEAVRGENVLVVQDHGVPIRKWHRPVAAHVVDKVFSYAYAGAPWSLVQKPIDGTPFTAHPDISSLSPGNDWRADHGGNGGFSFRKRSWLLKYAHDLGVPHNQLLANGTERSKLGNNHEDWIWGQLLGQVQGGVAPKLLENQFSSELLWNPHTLSIHNFHVHHSIPEMLTLVLSAAEEFFGKPSYEIFHLLYSTDTRGVRETNPWHELKLDFPDAVIPPECFTYYQNLTSSE